MLDLCIFLSWFRWDDPLIWKKDSYFSQKQQIEVKNVLMMGFITNMQLVDYWCFLFLFISCLDSHSDGTHSLQLIHWWTSDVMLNFYSIIYILDSLRVSTFPQIVTKIIPLNPANPYKQIIKSRIRILSAEITQKSSDSGCLAKIWTQSIKKHKLKYFMKFNNTYLIVHAHFAYFLYLKMSVTII